MEPPSVIEAEMNAGRRPESVNAELLAAAKHALAVFSDWGYGHAEPAIRLRAAIARAKSIGNRIAPYDQEHPSHWEIYENGVGGWYAWNSRAGLRLDLIHKGEFSQAIEQFIDIIGDYYGTRGSLPQSPDGKERT